MSGAPWPPPEALPVLDELADIRRRAFTPEALGDDDKLETLGRRHDELVARLHALLGGPP